MDTPVKLACWRLGALLPLLLPPRLPLLLPKFLLFLFFPFFPWLPFPCMLLLLPLSPHTEACVQACVELAGGQGPGPSGQGPAASGQAGAELAGTPRGQGAPLASNPGGRGQGPGGRVVREELRKLGAKAPEVLRTMHPSHNLRKRKRG